MKKISEKIYIHRNHFITKDVQEICVEGHLEIFPTWNDAKEFINKIEDGTNKKEPKVIGSWKCDE